jgi:alginate O-acetyltransferase complex protein AlgI
MLFVQFRFVVFFLIVFAIHWLLQSNKSRKILLLLSSHFFYACLFLAGPDSASSDTFPPVVFLQKLLAGQPLPTGWWFPVVMLSTTTLDYFVGRWMGATENARKRRTLVAVSIVANLCVLGFFKYANFCIDSVHAGLAWFGLPTSKSTLNIFLPAGISFYTFQSMSYVIDVYRKRFEPIRRYVDLSFYITFFPQLVAGPIVRAMTFLPQVFEKREWANVDVRGCLTVFFIGFIKKACISENISTVVDAFFAEPWKYDVASSFIGVLFYAVQVYCDFSGYSDMAIGTAGLLGYALTINFAHPYFSPNIGEHWRRWHISLSTWLRDYLYIPLGGNRGSRLKTNRNLMLVMLIGGLWHGAAWGYILWGAVQGIGLIVHREFARLTENAATWFPRITAFFQRAPAFWSRVGVGLGTVLTFYWVCISYVFFRANPIRDEKTGELIASVFDVTGTIAKSFVLFQKNGNRSFDNSCFWLFGGFAIIHWLGYKGYLATWWRRIPDWLYAILLGIGLAIALFFLPQRYKAFIYFQF